MNTIFRALISTSLILTLIYWFIPWIDYLWLSAEQVEILNLDGFGEVLQGNEYLYWFDLTVWVFLSVGLYFYFKIARLLFCVAQIAYLLMQLFWGIQIFTPIESVLSSIINLLDGAIIYMAYFSSVANNFKASRNSSNVKMFDQVKYL